MTSKPFLPVVGIYCERNGEELEFFDAIAPRPNCIGFTTAYLVVNVSSDFADLYHPLRAFITMRTAEFARCFVASAYQPEPAELPDTAAIRRLQLSKDDRAALALSIAREAAFDEARRLLHLPRRSFGRGISPRKDMVIERTGAPMLSFENAVAPFDTKLTIVETDGFNAKASDGEYEYDLPERYLTDAYFRIITPSI